MVYFNAFFCEKECRYLLLIFLLALFPDKMIFAYEISAGLRRNNFNQSLATISANATGGYWDEPSCWEDNIVPDSTDHVIIPNGTEVTIRSSSFCNDISLEGELNIEGEDTLYVSGNWSNSGVFDPGRDGTVNFIGELNSTLTGNTDFRSLIISKGLDQNTSLNIQSDISYSGNLELNSGLLHLKSGITQFNGSTNLSINSDAGIHVNGAELITAGFSIINDGLFKVSSGKATVGARSGNSLQTRRYGTLWVEGGELNIAGRLINTAGVAIISGGTINISTLGHSSSTYATFDMSISTHLEITGGEIRIHYPNGTSRNPTDIRLRNGGSKEILGGTFILGGEETPSNSIFRINNPYNFYNLTINSGNAPSIQLVSNDLCIHHQLSMNGGNINSNGNSVVLTNEAISAISRSSGYIIGNLTRAIQSTSDPHSYLFPTGNSGGYFPLDLVLSGETEGGLITVCSNEGDYPDLSSSVLNDLKSINSYWTIDNSAGITANLTQLRVSFSQTSLDPEVQSENLIPGVCTSSVWSYPLAEHSEGLVTIQDLPEGIFSLALAECKTPLANLLNDPPDFEFCVESIYSAEYNGSSGDDLGILPARPEYHLFEAGRTDLDLLPDIYYPDYRIYPYDLSLNWTIKNSEEQLLTDTEGNLLSGISGQLSNYSTTIFFPGADGQDVNYTIYYWLSDDCGNNSDTKSSILTIRSRPQLIKLSMY